VFTLEGQEGPALRAARLDKTWAMVWAALLSITLVPV